MIVVRVAQTGITVDGHAEYAETGKDIVCAAVSALTQTLIAGIKSLTEDRISYEIKPGKVNIVFENLSKQAQLLVDSFFIGISEIITAYGEKYVRFL